MISLKGDYHARKYIRRFGSSEIINTVVAGSEIINTSHPYCQHFLDYHTCWLELSDQPAAPGPTGVPVATSRRRGVA